MTTAIVKTCQWPKGCAKTAKKREFCVAHYWKLHRSGRFRRHLVDTAPVRERIQAHLDRDRRITSLAALAGLHHNHVADILTGHTRSVTPATARRLLSVPLRPSTIGCIRRIQAMQHLGYRVLDIAALAGVAHGTLRLSVDRRRFTDPVAAALADAFDRLPGDAAGPSRLAAVRAAAHGYAPLMAWEGVDIDDPAARPLGVRVTPLAPRRRAKVTRPSGTSQGGEVAAA